MCGIAGCLDLDKRQESDLGGIAAAMARTLGHRGPDDHGVWASEEIPLALAHRRLSILDLSPNGHQPMSSADGRYVIVYNGEIYNFLEIRNDLENEGSAPNWRGRSDTEVVLAAVAAWASEPAPVAGGLWSGRCWRGGSGGILVLESKVVISFLSLTKVQRSESDTDIRG